MTLISGIAVWVQLAGFAFGSCPGSPAVHSRGWGGGFGHDADLGVSRGLSADTSSEEASRMCREGLRVACVSHGCELGENFRVAVRFGKTRCVPDSDAEEAWGCYLRATSRCEGVCE